MSDMPPPRQKILVLASTFPRWQGDTLPPFVYELSRRLARQFEVHLLAPAFPGAAATETMDGIHVHRFRYFFHRWEQLAGGDGILPTLKRNRAFFLLVPFFLWGEYIAARRLVKQLRPAVVHAHWIIPQGMVARLVDLTTPIDYVVTSHGGDIFGLQGGMLTRLKKWILGSARLTTVVSQAIRAEVARKIAPDLPMEVISMGVDATLFSPHKRTPDLRQKHAIEGAFLLFVGRLAEKKGVRYLLEAMPDVLRSHPDAKLMIIGKGPLESELKARAQALGIADRVIFMGAIPNPLLPQYYATADIFIGPSIRAQGGDTEGFGLTFVEAGMSGAWLIGSDVGGVSDIIREGENGNLVEEKNAAQIAAAINHVLENGCPPVPTRVATFQSFDWEVIAARYAEALLPALQHVEQNPAKSPSTGK